MNQKNKILLGVLLLQVVLLLITWFATGSKSDARVPETALLAFKAQDISRIQITAMNAEKAEPPIILARNGQGWVVESAEGYPAEKEKVEAVIKTLLDIKVGAPLASNPTSFASLNVADNGYDRKIEITAGKETKTLFLGRGGRSSGHVRFDKQNDVMEARGLSVWGIASSPAGFVNTQIAQAIPAEVTHVTVTNAKGTLDFTRTGDGWTTPALPEGKLVDGQKVDGLIARISSLNLTTPIGKTDKPEYGLTAGARVLLEGQKEGAPFKISYTVGTRKENNYYVRSDDNPFVVTISAYAVEQAVDKALADFLKDPPAEGDTDQAPPDMGMGMEGLDPAMLQQLQGMNPQMMGM